MKGVILVIFTLFFAVFCNAQENGYTYDFSGKINVKLGLDTNSFSYKVSNSTDSSFYELKPNESVRTTASLQYKFIGLTVGFSPKFLNNNEDEVLKGESDINTIQLRLFIKQFIQEFNYYKIGGFYIENTGDFIDGWIKDQDSYLKLGSLKLKRFGGKTAYVWNKNFSFKALLVQNEKQAKSAGSFVPSISYFYSELTSSNQSVIIINESNFDLNVNAGYIHNFVFGRNHDFFASLGLSPGFGLKFAKTIEEDENNVLIEKSMTHPNFSLEGRLNLGYNSDTIFTGMQFNTFGVSYNKSPENKVEDSNAYFQIYFGYRFGAPKMIERLFNKIKI